MYFMHHTTTPYLFCILFQQENLEKNVFQKQSAGIEPLQSIVTQISKAAVSNPPQLHTLSRQLFSDTGDLALTHLSREHLEQLAACHNLCAFTFLYSWSPSSFLVKWLTNRAQELREDDRLLSLEGDIDNLSTKEVIDACLRRGILTKGVYATLVVETGEEEEDGDGGDGDDNVDTSDSDIARLMADNWDVDLLRERLRCWVGVVSELEASSESPPSPPPPSASRRQENLSFYVHASALGLLVRKE